MTKVGVVVARFQVPKLHAGHLAVINEAKANNDHVIVLLGCSDLDGRTAENPLLFLQRKAVVQNDFGYDKLHILPLHNSKSNREWSRSVDNTIHSLFPGCEASIYVGRDSVVPACYTGRAKIVTVEPVSLDISGTQIRASITPCSTMDFMLGQTFALQYQFPHAYQCVDIGVYRGTGEILLIQRADTGAWCLPGGFVDPTDTCLEHAAKRELFEETGLTCEGSPQYIMSAPINDWRYRGRDKIMSALFAIPFSFGNPCKTEECIDYKWVANSSQVEENHKPFVNELFNRINFILLTRPAKETA